MTYSAAITETGAMAGPGTDLVLAFVPNDGRITHAVATSIGEGAIDLTTNVYLASGAFAAGTVNGRGGRSADNLRSILWLPFDADLTSYAALDATYLHGLPQDEIDRLIAAQRADLEDVFRRAGVPIHRLDYTGYGLCAYLYLEPVAQDDLPFIRETHKALIARLNATAGFALIDRQVSDAGTRITRLPGSRNVKNPALPRTVTTLHHTRNACITMDQLRFARARVAGTSVPPPPAPVTAMPDATADELVAAIAPHWTLGQKHALALGLTGMLAKAGVPEAQALAIVERLSADDTRPWDRQRCVRDTYARHGAGRDTRGYHALRELLPETVLAYVSARLDRFAKAKWIGGRSARKAYEDGSESEQAKTDHAIALEFPDAPASAYYGWFGDYRNIMAPTSEAPDTFHLGSSLAIAGAMIGRRVAADYASDPLYANLFVILVGASGSSRKDTAMKRATRLSSLNANHRYVDPAFGIHRSIASSEGLVAQLKGTPNLLVYLSELDGLLQNMKRQATASLTDRVIEAWDTPPIMQTNSKNAPVQVRDPFLSILAGTQPGRLAIGMTEHEINSGFANRLMYFVGAGKPPIARPESLDKVRAWDHYLALNTAIHFYREDTELELDPAAFDRWDDWYMQSTRAVQDDENLQVLQARHGTIIYKIALIFAVSDTAPKIEDRHLAAAIDLVEWMWVCVKQLSKTWGVGIDTRIEERILAALRRRGPLKRWRLQQLTNGPQWGQREFAGVVRAMLENQTIVADVEGYIALNPEIRR